MTWKKWVGLLVVIVGVVGAAWMFLYADSGKQDQKYRTAKVERGDITMAVTATGTLSAITTVQVGSQVSGTIAKLYTDFNGYVQEGQVIAQIDPTFLQAQVTEAEANLERAQATVNEAKQNYDRVISLAQQQFVAQAEVDQRRAAYETALASRKQAEAALERAQVNFRYATIRAPISGVVINRNVDVGQTVAASFQTPNLFMIANDLARMQLQTSIDEADIGKIQERQQVTFTVDAYPDQQFGGQVSQIRLAPVTVQNVVTYTVIVDVPNPDMKLKPGMTANVTILVAQRENVLKVPTIALRFRPQGEGRSGMGGAMGMSGQASEEPKGLVARVKGWFSKAGKDSSEATARGGQMAAQTGAKAGADSTARMAGLGKAGPEAGMGMPGQPSRTGEGSMAAGRPAFQGEGRAGQWTPDPAMLARMRERMGGQEVPDSVLIAQMRARFAGRGGQAGGQRGGSGQAGQFAQGGRGGFGGQSGMAGMAGMSGRRGARPSFLWTVGPDGKLKPIPMRTGISDGTFTEVIADSLVEGQEIVVALTTSSTQAQGGQRPGGMMMFGGPGPARR
ncbi:MAG: efflux RND transporter periplasmic adaptor subunit [Candidatus Latescibacteria bacterium]|nr:efflux RND transporter periplasmic adaptor subunit [Candidatus Latescibacterota bacterium]